MIQYTRKNHILYADRTSPVSEEDKNAHIHCDSINKTKKKSIELQKSGHTVSKGMKRTHRLHCSTAKR